MRGERPRRAAAVQRLQHRRLDLHEAVAVEHTTKRGNRGRTGHRERPRLLVDGKVEVAAAVTGVDIGQAVELLGQRPQALGQKRPLGHPQRELTTARHEHLALGGDHIAEIGVRKRRVALLAETVESGVQL